MFTHCKDSDPACLRACFMRFTQSALCMLHKTVCRAWADGLSSPVRSQGDQQGIKGAIGGAPGSGTGTLPMMRRNRCAPVGSLPGGRFCKSADTGFGSLRRLPKSCWPLSHPCGVPGQRHGQLCADPFRRSAAAWRRPPPATATRWCAARRRAHPRPMPGRARRPRLASVARCPQWAGARPPRSRCAEPASRPA